MNRARKPASSTSPALSDAAASALLDGPMYGATQLAKRLGVGRTKANDMLANGTIPSVDVDGLRRVPALVLARWIATRLKGDTTGLDLERAGKDTTSPAPDASPVAA